MLLLNSTQQWADSMLFVAQSAHGDEQGHQAHFGRHADTLPHPVLT
jgi:hypothetical protein